MNLAEYRAALRLDLNDPAGAAQRFSDADLNRAVARAVSDLTLVAPRVTETTVNAGASRTQSLPSGTFPGLLDVEGVEYPIDEFPQRWVPFRVSPDLASVYLVTPDVPAAGVNNLRIRWQSAHAVLEASTTVPAAWDGKVALGAFAYACLAYSTPASDNFKYDDGATVAGVDDSMIAPEWRARYRLAVEEWKEFLGDLRTRRNAEVLGGARVSWSRRQPVPRWPAGGVGVEP